MARFVLNVTTDSGTSFAPANDVPDVSVADFIAYLKTRLSMPDASDADVVAKWFSNSLVDTMSSVAQYKRDIEAAAITVQTIPVTSV